MTADWEPEARPVPDELETPQIDERLSVLRGFTVADHLNDRDKETLLEWAKHVI